MFQIAKGILHRMDPEKAHTATINALKMGMGSLIGSAAVSDPILKTSVFGIDFPNPVGLAAGFDKDAEVTRAMLKMGFGFVEAGTVTPKPQIGNPKPRLFRLSEDAAVINRFGFNNKGLKAFKARLTLQKDRPGIIGANVGANKDSEDRTADYVTGVDTLYGLSQYFTINISSPNTPGLRALQSKEALEELITRVVAVRDKKVAGGQPSIPMLVKVAPDVLDEDIADICDVTKSSGIDGLIVGNTTISRPDSLLSDQRSEMGGLSGKPLMQLSTDVLKKFYRATGGGIPLVGVGGIASGEGAYMKIRAGASLIQLYSALVYEGPSLVSDIKRDLATFLKADGFEKLADAVGVDAQ
jgi:dihydroorotate dehydrogenase